MKNELTKKLSAYYEMQSKANMAKNDVFVACREYLDRKEKELLNNIDTDANMNALIDGILKYEPEHYKVFALEGLLNYIEYLATVVSINYKPEYEILYAYMLSLYYFPTKDVKVNDEIDALDKVICALIDSHKELLSKEAMEALLNISEKAYNMASQVNTRLSYEAGYTKNFLKRLYVLSTMDECSLEVLSVNSLDKIITEESLDMITKLKYVLDQEEYYRDQVTTFVNWFIGQDFPSVATFQELKDLVNLGSWL